MVTSNVGTVLLLLRVQKSDDITVQKNIVFFIFLAQNGCWILFFTNNRRKYVIIACKWALGISNNYIILIKQS